ncbi:metallophosphoesterase [Methanotrichaceae archaeon M04Ac]|uniref:Metallophosphoesterase n=1 Tax=Candidatus Methanocrinis alkalitolerans TaxID=3033395 RepID=A0ABT5XHA4_9EURY|nr:metallophosphoesterase [Candidatus Methanocrinis alkalitolerans]MDF0594013.1 metallophosphoesterase [Candidatus Methanocrinis alkalitolerans]
MASANQKQIRDPIIVISDVHLGSCDSDYRAFREFIDFLNKIKGEGCLVKDSTKKIYSPGTIIFLGDILEFWKPAGSDRNYIIECILPPLSALCNLNCDIIYVTGNHDEDLWDIKYIWGNVNKMCKNNGNNDKPNKGVKFPHDRDTYIKIFERTYPERSSNEKKDGEKIDIKGIEIGDNNKYIFIHGHQFDKWQVTYRISRGIEKFGKFCGMNGSYRFDPIDYLQDLANSSFSKRVVKSRMETMIFIIVVILYLVLTIFYVKANKTPIWSFVGIGWMLASSFIAVTVIPKIAAYLFPRIWDTIIKKFIKHKSVEQVITNYYKHDKGKNLDADVIVFGHTHNPGQFSIKNKHTGKDQLFINTGCWVKEKECDINKLNTFLYIDKKGHHLLKWDMESKDISYIKK